MQQCHEESFEERCPNQHFWACVEIPAPSLNPPLGYLQWLELFFYCVMSAHVSFIRILMCLNYVQNLKERVHAVLLSKDDPEKKSFGAMSLCKHVFKLIPTARCYIYILY